MTDKKRKVIVVTGGGQGIGRAICLHFAARDFNVVVVDKNPDTAKETAHLGKLEGIDARAFPCDLTDRAAVRKAFREIDEAFGRIDVVIYNSTNGASYTGISSGVAASPFSYQYAYWGNGKALATAAARP